MLPLTDAPGNASQIAGMADLRGLTIPVAEFTTLLGYPPSERTADTRILIVERGGSHTGLIVDAVTEVKPLNADEMVIGASMRPQNHDAIVGVARMEDQLVSLVTVERLLDDVADELEKAIALESAPVT